MGAKSWERPWSMEEIVDNSSNWSLAGDVALLNTLKQFSQNVLTQSQEINENLTNLSRSLDETSVRLNVARNEFQGLKNCQFIESRVYEDDESLPDLKNEEKTEKNENPFDEIKTAALNGLKVLEEFFEKVEVSVSDSEDEDIDLPKYILRPKDMYLERPLPYVIGTDDWYRDSHVGMEDSSDSESEKEKFSESDSDSDVLMQDRTQLVKPISESSSDSKNHYHSSDSEKSAPPTAPILDFAELAQKLGQVEPQINTRPIQPQKYGDFFSDEPPPLDDTGLFSSTNIYDSDSPKKGLFDDDDDDIFEKPSGSVTILGGGKKLAPTQLSPEKPKIDLFDSDEEADLFKPEETKLPKNEEKVTKNLFDDDDDLFKDDLFSSKKFSSNLFDDVEATPTKSKPRLLDSPPPDSEPITSDFHQATPTINKLRLFDSPPPDSDDLFVEPITSDFDPATPSEPMKIDFGSTIEKHPLFDSPPPDSDDLFEDSEPITNDFDQAPPPEPIKIDSDASTPKKLHLFDSPPPDSDDLFVESEPITSDLNQATPPEPMKIDLGASSTNKLLLFDSPPPDSDDLFQQATPPIASSPPISPIKPSPQLRLFDSPPPDDIFAPIKPHSPMKTDFDSIFGEATPTDNLFDDYEPIATKTKPTFDIFDSTPPPDEITEPIKKEVAVTSPSKVGALKQSLKINVGALVPGFVPKKETAVVPSFDEGDSVDILHNVTKDRARASLKRRPSTRRGRKEALKRSNSDFKLEKEEKMTAVTTNALSDDDDQLFTKKTVLPIVKKEKSLFDDDDDDDDDDFFVPTTKKQPQLVERKLPKSSVKKLENTTPDDDPLSAMLK